MRTTYRFLAVLSLSLLCAAFAATGQQLRRPVGSAALAPATTNHFTHVVDSLLQPLDKSQIASGILYDRVMPLAGLHAFQATDTATEALFHQAYLELHTAAYSTSGFSYQPDDLVDATLQLADTDPVQVGLLDYTFHYLDTLALDQNLIRQQNQLFYDVVGRPRSPYVPRRLVVAAALADTLRQSAQFTLTQILAHQLHAAGEHDAHRLCRWAGQPHL